MLHKPSFPLFPWMPLLAIALWFPDSPNCAKFRRRNKWRSQLKNKICWKWIHNIVNKKNKKYNTVVCPLSWRPFKLTKCPLSWHFSKIWNSCSFKLTNLYQPISVKYGGVSHMFTYFIYWVFLQYNQQNRLLAMDFVDWWYDKTQIW